MTAHQAINLDAASQAGAVSPPKSPIKDDLEMMRAARDLTKDIAEANPRIYWPDMLGSAGLGYAALAGAILTPSALVATGLGIIAALALYRALLFIHELAHIHRNALPGFRTTWNLLVGIPMLTPSFMYEGVHTIHHQRTRYGTAEDPEYLPLALMKPWSLPSFLLVSLLLPIALLVRFAILTPLGVIIPPLRKLVWQRFSSLAINPDFRRREAGGDLRRRFFWQEAGCTLWSITLLGSTYFFGLRPLLIGLAILSLAAMLNQVRTLVAHLWENDGEAMTVTAQYLDSVNVPPPGRIAAIWAPVGLRYHALHHLMPSMPYHSLGEAHRRLTAHMGAGSTYDGANHPGLMPLVNRLAKSTMAKR